jgi:hypothetical protein
LLLSLKAGLRAGEIAKLTWDMVAGPTGKIGHVIELRDCAAKKKSGRLIPIHPACRPRRLAQDDDRHRAGHSIGARRPDDAGQHRSRLPIGPSAWQAARRIQAAERSSPGPPGWFTRQAARCEAHDCAEIAGPVQATNPVHHAKGQGRQHQDDNRGACPVYAGLARLHCLAILDFRTH